MASFVVLLVLLSALMHASWNAFLHLSNDRVWLLGMFSVPYVIVSAIGACVLPLPDAASWPYIGASAVLELAYCFTLVRAYRSGDFGQIYPIARGLSPLLISAGALVFAHEALHAVAATGVVLVSLGIMSLAFRRGMRFSGESVPYALLTGLFIAVYSIVDGLGARAAGNALSYIMWVYLLWNVPQFLIVCKLRGGAAQMFTSKAAVARGMLAGVLALVAYCFVIEAFRFLPIAMVSALRELSSIFAVLIGWLFMKEQLTARRMIACALVTCGAVLIRL
ncbi:MAG: EamA family transporter [Paraburkholderia tropica]|uniref:EamA-like transporter family protein n=1 Tax=Paraburkholderia tropica TaxID=92647 RepID=A0ABX5MXI5_9BURK|nr:EamA family transporter [Paraburkholderia tropica]MBB2998631.1 drug/metabolite transporter (DMT)-like permease [Paraburkholderia tropica]MBB6318594.1 drug/metabolite transporter (DMT)-like permease [Paraburkholderia tropica]MDE1139507.1 EamA family transporter [Paraburkholderia tropica]PXX19960.1 EamA-like transporter family protein [Paraburkholderia tropica]PZW88901.1 EamA-like transporter family protein [Paraburkholderia tropica]